MEIRRALITGPTGGVGINLIEELIAAGITVTAVCRPESTRIAEIPKSSFVNVMMCPSDALLTLPRLCGQTYDAFFHFAWGGTSGLAREDLALQMKNIAYTVDAVRAALP